MGSQQLFCLRWSNHQTNLISVFDQLLNAEAFCDVTLACDGLSIKAHKLVLSACSPYFHSLFMDNPCKHPIVVMKDVKFIEMKALVDFMYKGEVNVTQEQLSALLRTAETLKVKGLTEVNTGGERVVQPQTLTSLLTSGSTFHDETNNNCIPPLLTGGGLPPQQHQTTFRTFGGLQNHSLTATLQALASPAMSRPTPSQSNPEINALLSTARERIPQMPLSINTALVAALSSAVSSPSPSSKRRKVKPMKRRRSREESPQMEEVRGRGGGPTECDSEDGGRGSPVIEMKPQVPLLEDLNGGEEQPRTNQLANHSGEKDTMTMVHSESVSGLANVQMHVTSADGSTNQNDSDMDSEDDDDDRMNDSPLPPHDLSLIANIPGNPTPSTTPLNNSSSEDQDQSSCSYTPKRGQPRILNEQEESLIVAYIRDMAAMNKPVTRKCVVQYGNMLLRRMDRVPTGSIHCNPEKGLSNDWWKEFKKRHPDLPFRVPAGVTPAPGMDSSRTSGDCSNDATTWT